MKKAFHIILIVKSPVGFYTIHRFRVCLCTPVILCLFVIFFSYFYYNVHTHTHTYHEKRTYTRSRKNDLMRLKRQTVFYGTPKHAVAAVHKLHEKLCVCFKMFYRRFAISTPYLNGVTSISVRARARI